MKKLYLIILSFLIISLPCISQKEPTEDIVNISRISFPDFGYGYELRVAKFKSLFGKISFNPTTYSTNSSATENKLAFGLTPTLNLSYRNYYNFNKRKNKNLRTAMNSLNYYSPIITQSFTTNNLNIFEFSTGTTVYDPSFKPIQSREAYSSTIGFVWGFQRNYKNRFNFDLSAGLGLNYLYSKTTYSDGNTTISNNTNLAPIVQISFGVWLNKVK